MSDIQIARSGARLEQAKAAMIMLHGRGATAESILSMADGLGHPEIAYIAPQAPGFTWYPYSFLTPIERNEPALSQALAAVGNLVAELNRASLPATRIVLIGFSQGGCLALEYAARNARRYGAVIGLSAGLIGPPGIAWSYPGSLSGTPVFLGCSDVDPHIPLARVHESAEALREIGGEITERIYPGMGHAINQDEMKWIDRALAGVANAGV
jgi:phospholipase/carboxylesterase